METKEQVDVDYKEMKLLLVKMRLGFSLILSSNNFDQNIEQIFARIDEGVEILQNIEDKMAD